MAASVRMEPGPTWMAATQGQYIKGSARISVSDSIQSSILDC